MIVCPHCGREIRDAHVHKMPEFPAHVRLLTRKKKAIRQEIVKETFMTPPQHSRDSEPRITLLFVRDWEQP